MVSLRFASLLLGFLVVSQTLISSRADQGWRMGGNWLKENDGNIASVKKGELGEGGSATEVGKDGQLGGRKMGLAEKGLKKGKMQSNGESSTTMKTGANHSDQKKLNIDGFFTFTADYARVPKHHPPRNN